MNHFYAHSDCRRHPSVVPLGVWLGVSAALLMTNNASAQPAPPGTTQRQYVPSASPPDWRGDIFPSWRLGLGASGDRGRSGLGFHLRTTAGVLFAWEPVHHQGWFWGVRPDLGYQHDSIHDSANLFLIGGGPFIGTDHMALQYSPHFAVGKRDAFAYGVEHGVSLSLGLVIGFEFSYTHLHGETRSQIMGGNVFVDPVSFVAMVAASASGRPLIVGDSPVVASLSQRADWC